jgi:DNA-binding CsgD family transcriptional regulator
MPRQSATAPVRVSARERERRAVELRISGARYEVIGAELGITRQAAHQAVGRVLARTAAETREHADELRVLEAERLEALHATLWPMALDGDLRAVDRVLRVRESFRRLFGLDLAAPEVGQTNNLFVLDNRPPWERPEEVEGEAVVPPGSSRDNE